MRFQSRVFTLAKDPEQPREYQDASQTDAEHGIAVIADGVSSAIFSAQWAALLTEAVAADPPNPRDPAAFGQWLCRQRAAWAGRIDTSDLAWFQRAKLPAGAFSTLLWIRLLTADPQPAGNYGGYRLQGFAIGDSCLFQVRGGELVRTFPIQAAEEFQADPIVLGSVDLGRDHLAEFAALDEHCFPDDRLVLCTDALAEWALHCYQSGHAPDWDSCWDSTEEQWQAEITELRQQRHMRYDDTTMVLLRVVPEGVEAAHAPPPLPGREAAAAPESDNLSWLADAAAGPSVSEQIAERFDRTSEQIVEGMKKLKEKALEKYWEKFGKNKKRKK
ncbi:MAG: hypothetical protein ABSG68_03230 [Thermoguttaceae bacterium]